MRVNAIIVAAGEGKRMGGGAPKPLLLLAGKAILLHTLEAFAASSVGKAVVVVSERERSKFQRLLGSANFGRLQWTLQNGGARRQDSVACALAVLDADCEIVVVHDAVRPLVSRALIDRGVDAAQTSACESDSASL